MNILLSLACVLAAVTAFITYVYLRGRNSSLRKLQGPESPSLWLGEYPYLPSPMPASSELGVLGNESQLRYQNEVGEHEFKWMRRYGTAWRRTGTLGVSLFEDLRMFQLTLEYTYRSIIFH